MTTLLIESLHQPLSAIARETRDATGSFEGDRGKDNSDTDEQRCHTGGQIRISWQVDVLTAGKERASTLTVAV
jgi:hypothetical protein